MKYSEMRVDFLGAARVIDNFIDGTMEPYSYEDYLRDFINHSDYFLQSIPNGAGLMLENGVEVRIFYVNDAMAIGAQRWHFQVIDGRDAISWLDVLLDYDFIGAWYLTERRYLAIESDELVFGLQREGLISYGTPVETEPEAAASAAPQVEVLQPQASDEAE